MTEKFDGKQFGKDMANAFASMNNARTERDSLGVHFTEPLKTPRSDLFGDHQEKLTFEKGCLLDHELQQGGAMLVRIKTEKGSKVVEIGKTPDRDRLHKAQEYLTKAGAVIKEDPGEPGEYLMAVQQEDDKVPSKFRFLDASDVANVALQIGGEFRLGNNQDRKRYIGIDGQIDSVTKLR